MTISVSVHSFPDPFLLEFEFIAGDANGLDEPEFFRKFQPSHHSNAPNSSMDHHRMNFFAFCFTYADDCSSTDINIRKDQSSIRSMGDDPFALDGFGDCE